MNKLYYVVHQETYDNGSPNGLITIGVYRVEHTTCELKKFAELETDTDSPYTYEEEIQIYLDDVEETYVEYQFVRL